MIQVVFPHLVGNIKVKNKAKQKGGHKSFLSSWISDSGSEPSTSDV